MQYTDGIAYPSYQQNESNQNQPHHDLKQSDESREVISSKIPLPYLRFKAEMNEGSKFNALFPGAEESPFQIIFDSLQYILFIGFGYILGWLLAIFWGVVYGVAKFMFVWVIFPGMSLYRWSATVVAITIKPIFEVFGIRRHAFETPITVDKLASVV